MSPGWSLFSVFIKHFEILDILFLSRESYFVDSFFACALKCCFSVFFGIQFNIIFSL